MSRWPRWVYFRRKTSTTCCQLLLRPFPYFAILVLLSFLFSPPCIFLYNITPLQFRSSYLSVFTHFHLLITTSSSFFLSTCPNHPSLASLIFSLMFATPALVLISSFLIFSILFIPFIHPNILISVLSSKFCSDFLLLAYYFITGTCSLNLLS